MTSERLFLSREWVVYCTRCANTDSNASTSANFALNEFLKAGWRSVEGADLCPDCSGQGPR